MKTIALIIAALAVSACSSNGGIVGAVGSRVEEKKLEIEKLMERQVTHAQPTESTAVVYSNESWIKLKRIQRPGAAETDSRFNDIEVGVNKKFANLNDAAGTIASLVGKSVPNFTVNVNSDVNTIAPLVGTPGQPPQAAPQMPLPPGVPGANGMPVGFQNSQQALQTPTGQITSSSPLPVNYSGNLAGLMNLVASYYGISWKTTASGVVFYLLETKTYRIASLPGDTKFSSNVESQSGGSSSGGGTGTGSTPTGSAKNSTGVNFEGLSVWKATEDSIKQMLSRNGKVVASPAIGTVSVTDTPAVLAQVTEFIESQNVALNRQVSVNVRILSITLDDSDNYGINWDAVYSNLTDRSNPYSLALKTTFASATGSGNLILSSPSGTGNQWAGSSAIFSALSTQGKVSELTSSTLTTMNNQPAPVNVGRRISYAASSATTVTASAGSTTTLTPGSIQTGFSMTLVPHILDSRELLLQYSIDVSSLIALNTFTSSGSSIQTPDISTSNFIQRVRLRSGDTLVVAGFDQDNLSAVKGGIGSPDNVVLGGRKQGNTKRTMLVVLVQPNLVQ